ncbi:hypothetical protein [Halorubrum sp. DTA98]|uniref:hypothetical protein n=1 Tax=Halorubrum sp. DTA98 TaxID=3402163 RepID=UPI003AB0AD24
MRRRSALILLGAVTAGGAGVYRFGHDPIEDRDRTENGANTDRENEESPRGWELEMHERIKASNVTFTPISFDYEPWTLDDELNERLLNRIEAEPANDGRGDIVRVEPKVESATEIASLFRSLWGIGTETEYETTIDGEHVVLTGGNAQYHEFVAIVGELPESGAVVMVRAREPDAIDTILSGI